MSSARVSHAATQDAMMRKAGPRDMGKAAPVIAFDDPPLALTPLSPSESGKWLQELDERLGRAGLESLAEALAKHQGLRAFLGAVFSLSSFLRDAALIDPAMLADLLSRPFEESFDNLVAETRNSAGEALNEADLMRRLRIARRKAALTCGLADLGGWWDGPRVTAALSDFADAALGAAVSFLLRGLHDSGKLHLPHPDEPGRESGLIVLAMGKYGARELNYSSDIDLVLFFEPAGMRLETDDPTSMFARLARSLVRIMQERTGDGYVFRTDLRLRPDPGSTPLAIPVGTALNYYEAYGQNWERAAMIKARPAAGDLDAGAAFLDELAPFVWRKYLDYAAISDIHSIKRQMHAHRGHGEIAVAGHNIKLGRGGIREIEFFAQTQQLIAGGRVPALRCIRTEEALAALTELGWIDAKVREEMISSYWYLRGVEHRIQMVADEQSHTLPDDDEGLKRIALMTGEANAETFASRLTGVLRTVEKHYAGLFEEAPELTDEAGGNLVFTGGEDDPETVATLAAMGYRQPSGVIRMVRAWHFGRFPAVRTAQARELLTELTPGLLRAIADSGDPDATLIAFDRFLSGLPAGIQLFALLKSNPGLAHLLLLILGAAPRMAEIVTRRPHVFDGLLDPTLSETVPDRDTLAAHLERSLRQAPDYESRLNAARIFAAEQKFLIGVRLMNRTITPAAAGHAFSDLAEVLIAAMLECVSEEFAVRHGRIEGASICILGMGRLGSRELTAGSDLDLILLYEHAPEADYSDGEKPLAASHYFMRLIQRLIAAMSAPTAEGVIYELDFRLRPSGNAGPLATHVEAFLKYQHGEAWTWEHQALTRARPVAGAPELRGRVEASIREILHASTDPSRLKKDVREMRALIDKEKAGDNPFEVKTAKGGLIDIEFAAQWATLHLGVDPASDRPTSVAGMLAATPDTMIAAEDREFLLAALADFNGVLQLLRMCVDDAFDPDTAPRGLARMICLLFDLPDIRAVEAHLAETQKTVRSIFDRLMR
ncbi:MAG: bifunctional [glutamine synthetase] adenylyltransferase/[glutamine synthetase]-adenylyl-L-tyrosine phosphorylase [Pseudomonadota bacterium]|nr:bifunctional [glutamine synthetase] adenylyltransferase/[glutamine synthetase]-adenylyl-L-tyrosine phosphorylase [Pseudomonadota bacterium]